MSGGRVDKRITVGRLPGSDIVVHDERVSPHHCEILCLSGFWCVKDLNSMSGTRLKRGLRLSTKLCPNVPYALEPGDIVVIASVELPEWDVD
jgi:pSer/pThr/pTyr-binding forkhead associated (FHA) protein